MMKRSREEGSSTKLIVLPSSLLPHPCWRVHESAGDVKSALAFAACLLLLLVVVMMMMVFGGSCISFWFPFPPAFPILVLSLTISPADGLFDAAGLCWQGGLEHFNTTKSLEVEKKRCLWSMM